VRIRRRGGIAGNVAVGAELDTGELAAGGALESAVAALPWGRPAPAPAHPDAFRYEVTLPDDPGRGTAVLGEHELDEDALAPLLDRLARAGTLEPPRPSGGGR
jgi:hypothetical protein